MDKPNPSNGENNDDNGKPKYALLDSIGARFEQQAKERQEKAEEKKRKRQEEIMHSKYLKENVVSREEMASAQYTVDQWTRRHDTGRSNKKTKSNNSEPSRHLAATASVPADDLYNTVMKFRNMRGPDGPSHNGATQNGVGPTHNGATHNGSHNGSTSHGSTPQESTSREQESTSVTQDGPVNVQCSLINCPGKFTDQDLLDSHNSQFLHSPCDPRIHLTNLEAPYLPILYMCPACDGTFQDDISAQRHQKEAGHLPFYDSIEVSSYICPACCCIFESESSCRDHMSQSAHTDISYPFEDDMNPGNISKPIAVGTCLMDDYIQRCITCPFHVSCVECLLHITSERQLRTHKEETYNQHVISTTCTMTPADVIAEYICSKTCTTCLRLFDDPKSDICNCTETVMGVFVENDCTSFKEFIKRSSLTYQVDMKRKGRAERVHHDIPINVNSDIPINVNGAVHVKKPESSQSLDDSCVMQGQSPPEQPHRITSPGNKSLDDSCVVVDSDVSFNFDVQQRNPSPDVAIAGRSEIPPTHQSPPAVSGSNTEISFLQKMKSIIFLDLDNWPSFFKKLPFQLPRRTFVWGFHGGQSNWQEPLWNKTFVTCKEKGWFHLHEKCGKTKDSADFALVLTVGRMDAVLPKGIPFIIMSGDTGFLEVEKQMGMTDRRTVIINPHKVRDEEVVYAMVKSVADA